MAAVKPVRVRGTVRVPGDKSISHRALILSALAKGKSHVANILDSADVQSTAEALRTLGASIPPLTDHFVVTGKPARELRSSEKQLDCGNSGTTARLLAGVAAGAGVSAVFTGDASLSRRPMKRIAAPLRAMGARVDLPPHLGLPMTVVGDPLHEIDWSSEVASAQVKSAILLAALFGGTRARVSEPHLSRDHTERMLQHRGVVVERETATTVNLPAGQILRPMDVAVPGDPSSAAFFVALGLLADHADLRLTDVCLNDTRTGFFAALQRMRGTIEVAGRREEGGETVGTLIPHPAELNGIEVSPEDVPSMIDELPLLACVGSRAIGYTEVRGASELRVKESDRIKAIVQNLQAIGANAEELPDGFRILGSAEPLRGRIQTHGDHRIAMAFGILGAVGGNQIEVDDRDCVAVSYPNFWTDLANVLR
jgi:3-phosphoshikimate 1-carboxyvinyltransferase